MVNPKHPLETPGIIQILLYYLDHTDGVKRYDYRKIMKLHAPTANKAHELLFELQLIEIMQNPMEFTFGLTDKGKKIAQSLKFIQHNLDNTTNTPHFPEFLENYIGTLNDLLKKK